jgi:hypothetical protein
MLNLRSRIQIAAHIYNFHSFRKLIADGKITAAYITTNEKSSMNSF